MLLCRLKQGGQACFKKHYLQKNTGISALGPGQEKDGKEVYEKARASTGPKKVMNAHLDGTICRNRGHGRSKARERAQ